jgi:hypothetical protein
MEIKVGAIVRVPGVSGQQIVTQIKGDRVHTKPLDKPRTFMDNVFELCSDEQNELRDLSSRVACLESTVALLVDMVEPNARVSRTCDEKEKDIREDK